MQQGGRTQNYTSRRGTTYSQTQPSQNKGIAGLTTGMANIRVNVSYSTNPSNPPKQFHPRPNFKPGNQYVNQGSGGQPRYNSNFQGNGAKPRTYQGHGPSQGQRSHNSFGTGNNIVQNNITKNVFVNTRPKPINNGGAVKKNYTNQNNPQKNQNNQQKNQNRSKPTLEEKLIKEVMKDQKKSGNGGKGQTIIIIKQ